MNGVGCEHCCAIPPDAPGPPCWCECHDDEPVVCRCGKTLPKSCGFHPEGEKCLCIGSICSACLAELLGHGENHHLREGPGHE